MRCSACPRYLWPEDHQRTGLPFRDEELVKSAREATKHVDHLPFDEAFRRLVEESKERG